MFKDVAWHFRHAELLTTELQYRNIAVFALSKQGLKRLSKVLRTVAR